MPNRLYVMLVRCALALTVVGAIPVHTAAAQNVTDYMTQQVCVDTNGVALAVDPTTCVVSSRRHLKIGEALPYHKIDLGGYQISDSYPIQTDALAPVRAVQTYFYVPQVGYTDPTLDPRFGGQPYFNPLHGGYNILGSDGTWLSYDGTYDPAGGWQPWWTADCRPAGWRLVPGGVPPSGYGSDVSPTMSYPDCVGSVPVSASTVEWNHYNVTYAPGKTLDTLVSFHFAEGYGPAEVTYLTKEYGVTRWEAWIPGTGPTSSGTMGQCPNSLYSATLHGKQFYLFDCHQWTNIVTNLGPWDPKGRAANDPAILSFPVDPLYTSRNLLTNTHVGGSYGPGGVTGCIVNGWDRVNDPTVLNWAWDSKPSTPTAPWPFTNGYNCTLIWATPGPIGNQSLFQQVSINPGSTGTYTFGAMLWSPDLASSAPPVPVTIQVVQRNSSNTVIATTNLTANLTGIPATFGGSFQLNSAATSLTLAFRPTVANVLHEITGAWIAPPPTGVIPQ